MQTSYNSGAAHHSAFSSALPSSLNDPTTTSAHQRRSKPAPSLPQPHSTLSNRSSFMPWDDLEFPSPMENTGMKRTASYSSFLSKKSRPLYKPTLQHARALSGQLHPPDTYSAPIDDSLPTTLTKTPTYEYYGFVLYLVSGITYAMYLGWAYLPKEILDSMGITYYPSKYWSLALPIWLFVLVIYLYVAFFAINMYNTEPFDSFQTITDEHANPFLTMNSASSLTDDYVPDLMDIPIGMVNACLYQHIEGISDEEEEGEEEYDEEYDGSYFDDTNLSDWDGSADL
ncbi:PIG-P-domain-containing protein [Linnemannia elongata]|nr:PIG-P-domain-containing protein [Linnemannia elongata]